MFDFLIYVTLPIYVTATIAKSELGAIRSMCKKSHWLSNVNQLSCVVETSRCIMRASEHNSITLHRGCPLVTASA